MFKTSLLIAASLAVSTLPAHAAPRTAEVRIGDLDLASDAGRSAFERRVHLAAKQVCGHADIRDVKALQMVQSCTKAAKANAHAQAGLARNDVQVAAR